MLPGAQNDGLCCSTIVSHEASGICVAATYHINSEDELIALSFGDDVNLIDLYELLQALLADNAFEPRWPQLIDLRTMELDMKAGAMKPFVRFLSATYRPRVAGAIAIVLDDHMSAKFSAGIFRLACSLSDTEVFDDYGLAIKWLLQRSWQAPARQTG